MNLMTLYYEALKVEDRNHLTILISKRNSQSALFKKTILYKWSWAMKS